MQRGRGKTPSKSKPVIFLSWSGGYGKQAAEAMAKWLPKVSPYLDPWVSTHDIKDDRDFFTELAEQARTAAACIIFMTHDTPRSTWVAFETGLAFANRDCLIFPIVLANSPPADLGPLGHFHHRSATQGDLTACLEHVLKRHDIADASLASRINDLWSKLDIKGELPDRFPRHAIKLSPELETRAADLSVSNEIMKAATRLDLLALTYDTLSRKIQSMQFPNLSQLTVRAYAAPNQEHSHPVHQGNYSALVSEWTQSITSLLEAFCDSNRCPRLEQLSFVLLSTTPDFTGTRAQWQCDGLQGERIRMTFCVSGTRMDELPTFILDADPTCSTPSWAQFANLFESTGVRPAPPLTFTLFTRHSPRQFIKEFVERAAAVTNHPATTRILEGPFHLEIKSRSSSPDEHGPYMFPRDVPNLLEVPLVQSSHPSGQKWALSVSPSKDLLSLAVDAPTSARLSALNFFANFVALLIPSDRGHKIVLVNHKKDPWDYDVPGGKFSITDRDAQANVCREVFEELGWFLDTRRLKGPVGLTYEPRSPREGGTPGVIQYFYYILDGDTDWHNGNAIPDRSTKGHPLNYMELDDLIAQKIGMERPDRVDEPLCHLPLAVLETIRSELAAAH